MIIGHTGLMGSGKTISLTKRLQEESKKGKKIFSNMSFSFPYTPLTAEMLINYKENKDLFRDSIIVLDEIHVFMDSRRSMSKNNIGVGRLIVMTRKLGVTLYWTSQHEHQVDRRLKSNTDIMINCDSYVVEYDGLKLTVVNNRIETQDGRVYFDRFIANPYFGLYDTEEIIDFD